MPARCKPHIPTYRDGYLPHLATAEELETQALGLGTQEPVALYAYRLPDGGGGTCGLHERAAAVPQEQGAS